MIKKQIIIFLLSCWGGIAFLFAYLHELAEDNGIVLWGWLKTTLGFIIVFSDVFWFLPAMIFSSFIGVYDRLYACEIVVIPKTVLGWFLPIPFWFLLFNVCAFLVGICKRKLRSRKNFVS